MRKLNIFKSAIISFIVPLGLNGQHQHINASLAVQVCKTWLGIKGHMQSSWKDDGFSEMADHDAIPQAETFVLTEQMYQGQSIENYYLYKEVAHVHFSFFTQRFKEM